ncbi:hypothetical protein B0H34DRAFT_484626 [Crassisporium funariophilum]|nr:hypothetical protein B0H34DRAFT_484626 [Crassisporium funariophilum]
MATTDSPTAQVTFGEISVTPPSPLEPPAAPFTDHDDDEQRPIPSTSHDPLPPLPAFPTPREAASDSITKEPTIPAQGLQQQLPLATMTPAQSSVVLEPVPQMPQTYLTFLLISGRRRTMSFEPETAIGRVKELAWNSWPADWQDDRPPAPSYLRVLYLGRMLQDDETLINLRLPTHTPQQPSSPQTSSSGPTPTIVHLSIRPYPPPGEGDPMKKTKNRRGQHASFSGGNGANEPDGEAGCCRSCIIC